MRTLAKRYLRYSDSTSLVVSPFDHHGSMRRRSDTTGNGIEGGVGKLMGELGQRARHVVRRGHDDERLETVVDRPAPRLDRIAQRIERRIVEIDAAVQQAAVVDGLAGDVAGRRAGIDAGDEQALAAAGGEQFERVGDARGAAGQHHDAVGVAIERDFLARQQPDETGEAERERQHAENGELDGHRRDAPPSDGGLKARHRSSSRRISPRRPAFERCRS